MDIYCRTQFKCNITCIQQCEYIYWYDLPSRSFTELQEIAGSVKLLYGIGNYYNIGNIAHWQVDIPAHMQLWWKLKKNFGIYVLFYTVLSFRS